MVLQFAQRMYKIRKEDESDNHFRMMRMTLGMNGVRPLSISIKKSTYIFVFKIQCDKMYFFENVEFIKIQ